MNQSQTVTIPQSAAGIAPVSPAGIRTCIQQVAAEFPFPGYMEERKHAYSFSALQRQSMSTGRIVNV
jgi:hypothetical protein